MAWSGLGAPWAAAQSGVVPDASLRGCLNTYLGLSADSPISASQLASLSGTVECDGNERSSKVADLTGAEFLTGLTGLVLSHNNISDLAPLSALTGLTDLELLGNAVVSTQPLASLINLSTLDLRANRLTYLSGLTDLTNLTELYADGNQLTDITALAQSTKLTKLWLGHNRLTDITALAALTGLTEVSLEANAISDIAPLANAASLQTAYLQDNAITDLSPLPAGLALEACDAAGCSPRLFATGQRAGWTVPPGTHPLPVVQPANSGRQLIFNPTAATVDQAAGVINLPQVGQATVSWSTSKTAYFSGVLEITVTAPAVQPSAEPPAETPAAEAGPDDATVLPTTGATVELGQLLFALALFVLGLGALAARQAMLLPAAAAPYPRSGRAGGPNGLRHRY
jgi:hypothetical protein